MKLHVLAVGQKMPAWVDAGFDDYARRFHGDFSMRLQIISAAKRGANPDTKRLMQKESIGLLKAVPDRAYCVALAIDGKTYTSMRLAERLKFWQQQASETVFMLGGADGLAPECLCAAHEQLSLSPLTLPHGLARVVLAEQLYRAWSLLNQHPYHRE